MTQFCRVLCLLLLVTQSLSADENDNFDGFDREDPPRPVRRRGPHMPPPLERFDEDGDGMLSHEEIQAIAEKLKELDRDGDGYVDPRELAAFFSPPRRSRDNDFDRSGNGRDRKPRDGELRRPGPREDDDRFGGPPRGRRPPPGRFDAEGFEDDVDDGRRSEDEDDFESRDEDSDFSNRRRSSERARPWPEDDEGPPRGEGRDRSNADRFMNLLFRHDADGDGLLSIDEIPPKLRRHVQRADRNQDGMIDRRELEQFLSDRNR